MYSTVYKQKVSDSKIQGEESRANKGNNKHKMRK